MYLSRLYRYNKWLFTAIVFFAAMQLLIAYKRGMVVSPWYNYGMYSEQIIPQKSYRVNNRLHPPLGVYLVSPQMDDKINVTLDNLRQLPHNDSLYQQEIVRLFSKAHLPVPDYRNFQVQNNWKTVAASGFGGPFWKIATDSNTFSFPFQTEDARWNGYELILQKRSL